MNHWLVSTTKCQKQQVAQPEPSLPALCQYLLRIDVVFAPDRKKTKIHTKIHSTKLPANLHNNSQTFPNSLTNARTTFHVFFSKESTTKPPNGVTPPTEWCLFFLQGGRSQADAIFKSLLSFACSQGLGRFQRKFAQYVNTTKPLILRYGETKIRSRCWNACILYTYILYVYTSFTIRYTHVSNWVQCSVWRCLHISARPIDPFQPANSTAPLMQWHGLARLQSPGFHHRTSRLRRWLRTLLVNTNMVYDCCVLTKVDDYKLHQSSEVLSSSC